MSSISFPSIMLLESAILYIIHLNPTQKSPIEFRIGSTVFIELCSIVPDGAKTLNSLIATAPLFAAYVYFCICRKLANKLRSVVPLKSHHASVVKIDGCPVFSVLENIILFLERLPEFSDIEKMYEMNIPDLHSGDVRNFISPSLSPIDDLAHIVVGYSLWSSSPNFNENMKKMFIRLSLLLNDVLTSFKSSDEDIKQNQRESSVEEGEEGELEQGELIDDVDEVKDNCEQSSIPIRLAGFVCRMHEFGVIVDGQIQDVISRMTQIFQVFLNSKSISASEASALLKYLEKLPFNYNLSQVISNLKLLSPE